MARDRTIFNKFYDAACEMFEENFSEGSIYVSFPQYVGIVLRLLKSYVKERKWKRKNKELCVFTGLCITPVQWFNYHLTPVHGKRVLQVKSLNDIDSLHADAHWLQYHEFLVKLRCQQYKHCKKDFSLCLEHKWNPSICKEYADTQVIRFYRYLLAVDDDVQLEENFYLPRSEIVKSQLNNIVIQLPERNLVYSSEELADFEKFKNMLTGTFAYLMNDSTHSNQGKLLGEVLLNYFQPPKLSNIIITNKSFYLGKTISNMTYNTIRLNHLPLDFIIFGHFSDYQIDPLFALGCDVSQDKVRLSLFGRRNTRLSVLTQLVNEDLLI